MPRIKLHQSEWDQAKELFEKFVLAGNGSFSDRELSENICSYYRIGGAVVTILWRKTYRNTQESNRKVCGRLCKKIDAFLDQTKPEIDSQCRSKFIHESGELKDYLSGMWKQTKTGVIPSPIHFRYV